MPSLRAVDAPVRARTAANDGRTGGQRSKGPRGCYVEGMEPVPFLLFGRSFWEKIINWEALADAGTISEQDLDLFKFVESADEAIEAIDAWNPVPARQNLPGRER